MNNDDKLTLNDPLSMTANLYRGFTRGVATTVSMIRDLQATGAPECVTTVPLTGFSFLKKGPEGVMIREEGGLRTSYASGFHGFAPPRSCDLTPLDYFLWGYVKSLVYADKPQTLDHSEDNIRRVIDDIPPQMLEKVIENWTSRLDYIRASRGSHMPEIIFKM
ncbi:putative DD41D transposase [Trichonephila clavipes]|nr:putative DD41D transposase [Trichonephila clavipes]